MLIDFFYALRAARLPVSVREYLTLLQALQSGLVGPANPDACSLDDFYYLARTTLVKDESLFDPFDRAFAAHFKGVQAVAGEGARAIPADWLRQELQRLLSDEQKANAPLLDWDELMRTLQQRLAEQTERHAGGSKWIGTGGTSPFGHGGHNPQGIRIGGPGGQRSAVKVWEQRLWRDYDDSAPLGPRHLKLALRRLRKFARQGSALELDLPDTIRATAANAGWLELRQVPERHNLVKVLLLLDVGGSMDEHVHQVEALFAAAKAEFKHLEIYYFHNCVYDFVWKHNQRRHSERTATLDLLHTYHRDYKLIFVGDATMSPYEILQPGGSVEYANAETGADWLQRLAHHYPRHAWINPQPAGLWPYQRSIELIQQILGQRMYPLTLRGLEEAMRVLSK